MKYEISCGAVVFTRRDGDILCNYTQGFEYTLNVQIR